MRNVKKAHCFNCKYLYLVLIVRFESISLVVQEKENLKLQAQIDEVTKLAKEDEDKFDQLYRDEIAEGKHRNESFIRMNTGIKVVSDWMDEILSNIKERTENPTKPVTKSRDLEPEIEELTNLIEELKLPEKSEEKIKRLETEVDNASRELEKVKTEKADLEIKISRDLKEHNHTVSSLKIVLDEIESKN